MIPGTGARACLVRAMWSTAAFEPALPGRSSITRGSPVPLGPWSRKAHKGWNPKVFLNVAAIMHVPLSTVHHWALRNEGPPSFKIGKHRRYDAEAVARWLADRKAAA